MYSKRQGSSIRRYPSSSPTSLKGILLWARRRAERKTSRQEWAPADVTAHAERCRCLGSASVVREQDVKIQRVCGGIIRQRS